MTHAESTFTEEEEEKLQAAFSVEKQDLHLVLETITFILEQAVYHNLKPAVLKQQLEHSNIDHDKAEVFATTWSAAGPEMVEKFRQRILSPHKLETVGWQLNLQMAQSTQAKQKSPQAVLELGVTNEDSKCCFFKKTHCPPLTVSHCFSLFSFIHSHLEEIIISVMIISHQPDHRNWGHCLACSLSLLVTTVDMLYRQANFPYDGLIDGVNSQKIHYRNVDPYGENSI
ncbi:COMM domain-containing protein 10 [Varanus komodoensis]|nr:COMM domain-containing protein 10 [Varanus komodoensis]